MKRMSLARATSIICIGVVDNILGILFVSSGVLRRMVDLPVEVRREGRACRAARSGR